MKKYSIFKDYYLMNQEEEKAFKDDILELLDDKDIEPTEEAIEEECFYENQNCFDMFMEETKYNKINNNKIRAYANLGLWYGNRKASKDFPNLTNAIIECLEDYNEIYEDQYGNLHLEAYHHDGVNHFIFKKITDKGDRVLHYRKEVWGC